MTAQLLIPVDLSDLSLSAAREALKFADDSSEITLLYVYVPPRITRTDLTTWVKVDGQVMPLSQVAKREATDELTKLVDSLSQKTAAKISCEIVEGRAAETIVAEAKKRDSDLIIIGTHGRSGFKHLILGSVAEAVVRTAHCPVLTVPPPRDHV